MRTQIESRLTPEVQVGLDQLGTPLDEVEWTVVDLETTGLGARAAITEIGAVKVRGRTVIDEFHTMVNPEVAIPARITALTGITDSMVEGAPTIDQAYPAFAAWAGLDNEMAHPPADNTGWLTSLHNGPVLVAHNANFDIPFLRRAAHSCDLPWPKPRVVDTLALARLILPRPMVANHKLATLASHFHASPVQHRALGDALITVDVLWGLIELMTPVGVSTLEDLTTLGAPVPTSRKRKVAMADNLPRTFGTYRFIDEGGAPLYIGSATNLRSRVRSYFTASEKRAKVQRMLDLAVGVDVQVTHTQFEARINELRDIHSLRPLFNSASTRQDAQYWVAAGPFGKSRLETVPLIDNEALQRALGPFSTKAQADRALDALAATYCPPESAPLLRSGVFDVQSRKQVIAALRGEHREVVDRCVEFMESASEREDYETATRWREALHSYVLGVAKRSAIVPVALSARIIWAFYREQGGWELHMASWGRHIRSIVTPPKTLPTPWVEALLEEEILPQPDILFASATREECALIASSLRAANARLVHWDSQTPWEDPVHSPLGATALIKKLGLSREYLHDAAST
ncbi:MAG: exonuclease domain-containing protein [Actinomycetaceae bacterium]|nr:exonuclease domain-containing protein [Actinomycetaceae bacterium]